MRSLLHNRQQIRHHHGQRRNTLSHCWRNKGSRVWIRCAVIVVLVVLWVLIRTTFIGDRRSGNSSPQLLETSSFYQDNQDHYLSSQTIQRFTVSHPTSDATILVGTTTAASSQVIQTSSSSSSFLCRSNNALVLLAQKQHSTYPGRDSMSLLVQTLDLFRDNYLSLDNHSNNVDIFLFHTGDFVEADLVFLQNRLLTTSTTGIKPGLFRMVSLNGTVYWSLPNWLQHDQQEAWKGSEIYPIGYRHMCRWFGLQLWHFFRDLNQQHEECQYRYIARLDEDSFVLSPIHYDIFEFMATHHYVYGYRMCAFELQETLPKIWFKKWKKSLLSSNPNNTNETTPYRTIDIGLCGFYTNFFVADLQFFLSPPVTQFLSEIDQRGLFYRKRFGDLLVHTLAVYTFAPPPQIHRFLDFTYQHATIDYFKDREKECLSWGSIQAGYNDPRGEQQVNDFYDKHVLQKDCPTANITYLEEEDLSPTYAHLPEAVRALQAGKKIRLKTVQAGKVELPYQGILSG